ncbi:MAG: alpha,2-mannosidase [Sphaerisporangium sp.]|nr:alpha,2-mannosidase [Sphaerisporangium sp.]
MNRRRRQLTLSLLISVVLAGAATAPAAASPVPLAGVPSLVDDPTVYVNPQVGNQTSGTTFPGAALPFGMVQNSPDTNVGNASYNYDAQNIVGFSQVHLSGIGCPAGSWIRVIPSVGDLTDSSINGTASPYSHSTEVVEPGYYGVTLSKYNIRSELTATTRVGVDRFTYPSNTAQPRLIVNVTDVWGQTFDSHVQVVGDKIQGYVTSGSFCGSGRPSRYTLYFSMALSAPITGIATWDRGQKVPVAGRTEASGGAVISLAANLTEPLVTNSGVSYTSIAGAELNRVTEMSTGDHGKLKTFDKVRDKAQAAWRKQLSSVQVASDSYTDLRTFYTAMYHSLLHPSVAEDVDGTYQGFDRKTHKVEPGHHYYQMFSMWDTYRSQNQMVALIAPDRAKDMAQTILDIYQQGGWVPRWSLGQAETNATSGDPVTPFVVTMYTRGLLDDKLANQLFDALWQNVNGTPPPATNIKAREFNPQYLSKGYIPYERSKNEAASIGLEYSFADCALGTMAIGLDRIAEANVLRPRCDEFQHIWNPDISSKGFTGFPQVRADDGSFVPTTAPESGPGFKEGTAWQYQWLGQQDPQTLFGLMGGADRAEGRLDTFFAMPAIQADLTNAAQQNWVTGAFDYHGRFEFNPNNEPDFHSPWMYAWTNSPWKTSAVARAQRVLYTDDYKGLPGNDDLGATSALVAFEMMGFFEAQAGSGNYIFSAPMFPKIVITQPDGHKIAISAPGAASNTLQYIDTMRVDGAKTAKSWMSHNDLTRTDKVTFTLTTDPTTTGWGVGAANQPPAVVGTGQAPAPSVPQLAFVAPVKDATVTGTVPVTVSLAGRGLKAYNLRIDAAGLQDMRQPTAGTQTFNLDTTALTNGVHTLLATATDNAGHKSTITEKITVNNTPG